jgi:23S rRNA (adenine2503-C2)-methyltransferase
MKREIRSLSLNEIEEYILSIGEKKFRAKQLFGWISKGIENFDEASNLPLKLREKLEEDFYISNISILEEYLSEKDNTRKYLFELNDGNIIEGVLMKYKHGYSICLSTQIGCKMGCTFCASTMVKYLDKLLLLKEKWV